MKRQQEEEQQEEKEEEKMMSTGPDVMVIIRTDTKIEKTT